MKSAKKGDWVVVSEIVLPIENRSINLPEETKKVPLKMWVKGFIKSDANIGDLVEIETKSGRITKGTLEIINPTYTISFGNYIPEISKIGLLARKELAEVDKK